mmetsp:Transcript_7997/g.17285  ORF Transcript_7997/g.17285 Transcript_7997/m.17285 type:complete len:347 (+) Transcript_7997:100-1140(+)|eukprot:CAMPEP_0206435002 /NCGR_PEP_ID=MMETSP0324_2-20121206/9560_1 /ASSEMBLY_ACC=CAM_ASM_000836 /TAXON_ID=2866 /ORGANISM="Crypthecodinium cohnii, Strain Seligo" /LENGTH=346 /DNA_ID=CAMNT_0053901757 /DNA_START=26 /DNA_END=1066 /DNA_ORIENTATION=-
MAGSSEGLPEGWFGYEDDSGKPYYYNVVTQVTQWEKPVVPIGQPHQSAAEVFTYTPTAADLDSASVFGSAQKPPAAAAASPVGAESELVSLTGVPSGLMGPAGGAPGGATNAPGGGGASDFFSGLTSLGGGGEAAAANTGWIIGLLQKLFDVSTVDVTARLRMALVPFPPPTEAAKQELKEKPDFYGPFWVATTAVLFMAATGNFARLLGGADPKTFNADFSLVSLAAGLIYGFLIAVPVVARISLLLSSEEVANVDLYQMICICGYSLTPTIPVSLICLIPLEFLRWLAVLAGLAMSLMFLRAHLLAGIHVTTTWLKWTLIVAPCAMPVVIYLWYRIHFFNSSST